jgi:RNA polymerase sigma-70 factor (ECF subfamily)
MPTRANKSQIAADLEMADSAEQIYDAVLVVRCQAQDTTALAELIERFDGRLRYFIRKWAPARCGDSCAVACDDVLQEVWIDVWRGIGRLERPTALVTWLYTIARRRAIARFRRADASVGQTETIRLTEVPEPARDEPFSPDDAAAIHTALDRLSPAHREVLVLRFLEDMPYEEMARVVGCEIGTIKSRLHYAKLALRCELESSLTPDP